MKRVVFALPLLLVVSAGIFHQFIIDTYEYYEFLNEYPTVLQEATVTWETMSFSSSARAGAVSEPLVMQDLNVHVPFEAVYEMGEGYAHAYKKTNDDHSITVFSPESLDFFAIHADEFTAAEQTTACRLLKRTSATQACDSSQKFYEAFLRLNPNDISIFTRGDEKLVFLKLMIIKAKSLIAGNVSEFETEHFTGYFYHINERNFSVHLFPSEDIMYPVNLNDMTEDEATAILSHTTYAN